MSFEKGELVPLTPAQRKRRQRALEAGLPDPFPEDVRVAIKEAKDKADERDAEIERRIEECKAFDANGQRFKAEARSKEKLYNLFRGLSEQGDTDEETGDGEGKPKKKQKFIRPNPSATKIRIQNTGIDPRSGRGRRRSLENIEYEVDEVVSFERWLELRDRARKDLFWLGRLLGKDLYETVHRIICNQFVQKNFGGHWLNQDGTIREDRPPVDSAYFEGYTLGDVHEAIRWHQRFDDETGEEINPYGREVEMMLLDSRGFFKSTIDGIDAVQWLLNCPDIRILIITGEYKLATAFALEIKGYFYLGEGQDPSVFHLLFPEYVTTGVDGKSKEPLFSPARIHNQKEGSLWVNSIVANLSGWHCDIKKGDDVVTDENSNNEEQRAKLKDKYDGTDDLLDPHGFMDHIGTRYFTKDWYGTRLIGFQQVDGVMLADEFGYLIPKEDTETAPLKYFCRGCWRIKPEKEEELRNVPLIQLTAEDVILTFPQRWGFKRLRDLLIKKRKEGSGSDRAFRNQQLNIPTDEEEVSDFKVSFEEAEMRSHMYQREAAPRVGDIFVVWDWALSDRKTSDYSVGVAARLYKNDADQWSFVILEIIFNKWKHSELAHQIVSFSKKWGPKVTMIEASNGADMLKDEITRVTQRYGYTPYIYWKQPSRQENAKRNRIKSLEILLHEHRLHFVLGSWIDETIRQFTMYTGEKKNKGRKDDIADACSYLIYILPADARPFIEKVDPEEEKHLQEEQTKRYLRDQQYQRYFGGPQNELPKEQPPIETPAPKKLDPRMVIFGNKGPWRL